MLKRLMLLLAIAIIGCAAILSAKTTLWDTGFETPTNEWKQTDIYLNLSTASEGDYIRINLTPDTNNAPSVKLSLLSPWQEWYKADVTTSTTHVDIELTNARLTSIGDKSNAGFQLGGTYCTISSIELIPKDEYTPDPTPVDPDPSTGTNYKLDLPIPETKIDNWYDVANHDDTKGNVYVYVKPGYMPGVQAGDEVLVTFNNNGGGQANFVFKDLNGNWVKVGENGSTNPDWINDVVTDKEYVFPISATWAQALAVNGLYIDGQHVTVKSVKFHAKNRDSKPEITGGDDPQPPVDNKNYTTTTIWEVGDPISSAKDANGTTIVFGNDWQGWMSRYGIDDNDPDKLDQAFHIPAEKFYNAATNEVLANLDDCIIVTFSEYNSSKAQASFYFKDADGVWFKRGVGDSESVASCFDVRGTTYERKILNYRTVAALRHNGLWIDGHDATISKIELRNYSNEALSDTYPHFVGKRKFEQEGGVSADKQRGYDVTTTDDENPAVLNMQTERRIRPQAFANYINGERIVMYFNKKGNNPKLRLSYIRPYSASMRIAQGLTGTEDGICTSFTESDGRLVAVYRPTQREIRALKHNGLFLAGEDLELTELIFGISQSNNDSDIKTQDLWIHNDWMTFGHDLSGDNEGLKVYEGDEYESGKVKIYISYIHFQRAKDLGWLTQKENGDWEDGYKLTFYFPWLGDNAWMHLSYDPSAKYDSNRDPLNMYFEDAYGEPSNSNSKAPNATAGEENDQTGAKDYTGATRITLHEGAPVEKSFYDYKVSPNDIDHLLNYGLWIQGGNADMQNIMFRSPLSSPISGVEDVEEEINLIDEAINFNEPYEAWTIDGRRVADVEAPGLYIVRQGAKVQKILIR